jgi:protein FAM92
LNYHSHSSFFPPQILPELLQYDLICKNTKENVKEISTMRDKELAKTKQIYQIKHKNDNLFRKKSSTGGGDADSKRSRLEVSKTFRVMEEIVENFEKQKLHDLKQVLMNFILIQMKHYSKAMEVLTATYQDVADIDEIGDVEVS